MWLKNSLFYKHGVVSNVDGLDLFSELKLSKVLQIGTNIPIETLDYHALTIRIM
jgi:hypothetical protein